MNMDSPSRVLQCAGLSAGYGNLSILRNVDLIVDSGEVVAILGANGSGKTTLLRAICAEIKATGTVSIAGASTPPNNPEAAARAGVAHVPEGRGTFPDLSVEDNLRAGGYLLPSREVAQNVDRVYDRFPRLGERRGQKAGLLSGGEQQMLALGRGLMLKPRLLLLDEPSLGLSPIATTEFFEALRSLATEDLAVLVVEQNARLALSVARRGYVLETGAITATGTAAELLADPHLVNAYLGGSSSA